MSKVLMASRPNGWYFLDFLDRIPRGAVLARRIFDRDLVVFRTRSGEVAALDPFCPHMGAHLGRGGVVVGETLRCPFHFFRFDPQGQCVATGYDGAKPPRAELRSWPLQQVNGFLFVYYDPMGQPPSWRLPEIDTDGWTPPVSYAWDLTCHPQDIGENAIDIGHLKIVHKYDPLEVLLPFTMDGPRFRASYRLHRSASLFLKAGKMTVEITIHGYGLGYAHTEIEIPDYGIRFRNYTLVTPADLGRTILRVAISVRHAAKRQRIHPALWLAPAKLIHRMLARILLFGVIRDVGHDVAILKHRSYLHPPVLARGDGPVLQFRRWAQQFDPAV